MLNSELLYPTKADLVHSILKEKIVDGEWEQGFSININKVSKEMNTSIIPVREALKRLEAEGLVEFTPHKGASVTLFSDKKITEVISIRAVLEGYATKMSMHNMSGEDLIVLKQMLLEMEQLAIDGNSELFGKVNKEFHRYIYRNSNNDLLYEMIFNLWDGGGWGKAVFSFKPERMIESNKEHYEIIDAIIRKDEDKVDELVKDHKLINAKIFMELYSEHKE